MRANLSVLIYYWLLGGRIVKKSIIVIFVAAIILTGCNISKNNNKSKTAEIVVEINGGIPYDWVYTISNDSIVKYKNMEEKTSDTLGGSYEQHYFFECLKEGSTTIEFELKSIVDDTVDQTKNYEVVVDKNLNVTITEVK